MALSIDYMLQNGYNFIGIFTKPKYPSQSKVWMEIVTDGTRTDLVQFTQLQIFLVFLRDIMVESSPFTFSCTF